MRDFLDISEIYVQPTYNKGRKEGAPIAVLEAMANGKVVLGSNIPGIRDQLAHFPDYMFKAGDVNELKYLLNNFMFIEYNYKGICQNHPQIMSKSCQKTQKSDF